MKLWRVSRHRELNGLGGLVAPGRWHVQGRPIIYAAEHQATAQIEWLAQLEVTSPLDLPRTVPYSELTVPDDISQEEIRREDLPGDWERDSMHTQQLGDEWLRRQRSVLLFVPSVLVPARNVLINPTHPDAEKVVLANTFDFPLDPRLR